MRTKLFNIVSYALLITSLASFGYTQLPAEYQALIPQFNWLSAILTGGTLGAIGSGALFVDYKLRANESKYLELLRAVVALQKEAEENNKLLKADLSAKLSSSLVEEKVKQIIEGALK